MFRPASRALLRAPAVARGPASRRLISTNTSAESKPRSWKNFAVRVGLAAGAVYYYNTSNVFSKPSTFSLNSQLSDEEPKPTIDSIKPRIRQERESSKPAPKPDAEQQQQQQPAELSPAEGALMSPQELEEEAGQEAAFNPETGEINWDCPCLGGMAHGPCGEEFKAAFSCFVYSQEEPKGMDCIEKFKGMQDCFRQYPEVYGAELEDDEAAPAEGEQPLAIELDAASHPDEKRARALETTSAVKSEQAQQGELSESDDLLPKAWHDTEAENTKAQKTEK